MTTTPVLWQETDDLPGPFGNLVYLDNGNILVWRADVNDSGNAVVAGYILDSFGNIVVADTTLRVNVEISHWRNK